MQCEHVLHSTMQPLGLEFHSVSGNVIKPLWRLMRHDTKDFGLKGEVIVQWSDRPNEVPLYLELLYN